MTLYLDIPDQEWNVLLSEVEELLTEAEIGSHLLGAYPYGDRIFGDQSGAPGILCLYLDEPASLLDPCRKEVGLAKRLSIGAGCGPAIFISLYDWAKEVCTGRDEAFRRNLFHLIPPMTAPLYENPQLTIMMDLAREYLHTVRWGQPALPKEKEEHLYAAHLRALLILYHTDTFAPCLNKTWCEDILPLKDAWLEEPLLTQEADRLLLSRMSDETKEVPDSDIVMLNNHLEISIYRAVISNQKDRAGEKEKAALGQAVCQLYRSLL
jgi:hypothetical protein